jgi:hypothetical protein
MGVANATLIFDFSFESDEGKVTGQILGLEDIAGRQHASSVSITGIAAGTSDIIIDVNDVDWSISFNLFELQFGNIASARFVANTRNNFIEIWLGTFPIHPIHPRAYYVNTNRDTEVLDTTKRFQNSARIGSRA